MKKKSPEVTQESVPTLAEILNVGNDRSIWRSAVARVRHIHQLVRTGKYPNCRSLAKKFGLSKRSIERDMQAFRDSMDLPLEFDFRKNGYYYTREVPSDLPRPKMTAGDMVAFSLAKRALERFRGTDFAEVFEEALRKFMDEVEGEVPLELAELDRLVSIGTMGTAKPAEREIAAAVSEGLLRRLELELSYWDLDGKTHERRCLQPLHLRAIGESLLLFAIDPQREDGEVRRFVLSRMKDMRVTERSFVPPVGFDPEEEMRHSVGAYRGGKPVRVRIRLSALATRLLDERPLHHTQKIVLLKRGAAKGRKRAAAEVSAEGTDGTGEAGAIPVSSPEYCEYAELTMKVAMTPELEQRILYWGWETDVMEPASLREKIAAIGAVLAGRCRDRRAETGDRKEKAVLNRGE